MERSNLMEELRGTPYYKVGYLRGAIKIALEMLKHGSVREAVTRLEDSLITTQEVWNGDPL